MSISLLYEVGKQIFSYLEVHLVSEVAFLGRVCYSLHGVEKLCSSVVDGLEVILGVEKFSVFIDRLEQSGSFDFFTLLDEVSHAVSDFDIK